MIEAILTDIEGTTTELSFVKDVLFPYARDRMEDFLRSNWEVPAVAEQVLQVRELAGLDLDKQQVIDQLIQWIDEDQKITPLKVLQGMMWEDGYRQGDFTGHVYEDAVKALHKWHDAGIHLYVYSSGSVQAQKLLFGFSDAGDLTPLFSGYFDTQTGGKKEPESYRKIAEATGVPADHVLFLSDIEEELDAAAEAGMHTQWLVRKSEPDPQARHRQVASFDQIVLNY